LAIVVPTRSWREISWWKTQQTKNSLNFASTCLKVVDTRRAAQGANMTSVLDIALLKKTDQLPLGNDMPPPNDVVLRQTISASSQTLFGAANG
jgi:hypothetical protein